MVANGQVYEQWRGLARTIANKYLPEENPQDFPSKRGQAIAYTHCWQLAFLSDFYLSIETNTFSIPSFCHFPFLNSGLDLKFPKTPELSLNLLAFQTFCLEVPFL